MKIKIPERKRVEDIGELVLENRDAIYISITRGHKTVHLIGVALNKSGELIVSCFQPVMVIKHYKAKKK